MNTYDKFLINPTYGFVERPQYAGIDPKEDLS